MRKGGRRGGRGAGSRGGGGNRRGIGARGTSATAKTGFLSSVFALFGRMMPSGHTGRRQDGGGVCGIDDARSTRFPAAGPRVSPFPGRSASPQRTSPRRQASVDVERCTGCGACARVCPAGAITVGSAAAIDTMRCTGCGRCVAECPQDAISLAEIPRAADTTPLSTKKEK